MNYITIICECCGISKDIIKKEYNRKLKLGTKFYCSLKCSAISNKDSFAERTREYNKSPKNVEHLKKLNELNIADPFKYFIKNCKRRTKKDFNISLEFLRSLWNKQKGLCALTGVKLEMPLGTSGFLNVKPFNGASLDRIDSSKGYVEGNVQFICMGINFMKNEWPEEYFIKHLIEVSKSVLDKYSDIVDNNTVIEELNIASNT